jgi:hypothetical protein
MAPAFDRLAQMPWPIACCASSGTRPFKLGLGPLMLEMRIPGADENSSELRPDGGGAVGAFEGGNRKRIETAPGN